jgi:hypothetical protein
MYVSMCHCHTTGKYGLILCNETEQIIHKIMRIGGSTKRKTEMIVLGSDKNHIGTKKCNHVRGADYQHEVNALSSIRRGNQTTHAVSYRGKLLLPTI